MAMTKAEKARLEELEIALALHWPPYAAPEPMTREEIRANRVAVEPADQSVSWRHEVCRGWFCNAHTGEVYEGWSDGMSHNPRGWEVSLASQGMGRMYRTREDAAKALRLEMSQKFAAALARVDRIIRGEV